MRKQNIQPDKKFEPSLEPNLEPSFLHVRIAIHNIQEGLRPLKQPGHVLCKLSGEWHEVIDTRGNEVTRKLERMHTAKHDT